MLTDVGLKQKIVIFNDKVWFELYWHTYTQQTHASVFKFWYSFPIYFIKYAHYLVFQATYTN